MYLLVVMLVSLARAGPGHRRDPDVAFPHRHGRQGWSAAHGRHGHRAQPVCRRAARERLRRDGRGEHPAKSGPRLRARGTAATAAEVAETPRVTAEYHRREDVAFACRWRACESAAVRAFARALTCRGVSLGVALVVA
ncbi:hypothetical protein [Streptomyces luteogriseus]|uniref:hypothetical protein n=1 Tax=Streptomyces luteogriseus TaxID=68233 RepID=UPI0036B42415